MWYDMDVPGEHGSRRRVGPAGPADPERGNGAERDGQEKTGGEIS